MQVIQHTYFLRFLGIAVGTMFALALVPVLASAQSTDDDSDAPISGSALVRASNAALDHVGEGRVTDTEIDDEDGTYEVEVTKDNGTQVDVLLNRDFEVTRVENENESDSDLNDDSSNNENDDGTNSDDDETGSDDNGMDDDLGTTTGESMESVRLQIIDLLRQLILLLQSAA